MSQKSRVSWLSSFIKSQKQTNRFHPFWIVLAVATSVVIGIVMWVPAELVPEEVHAPAHPSASTDANSVRR